jgi:WD40 repeat protein
LAWWVTIGLAELCAYGDSVELIETFTDSTGPVPAIAFSHEDRYLIWGGSDCLLRRASLRRDTIDTERCQELISQLDDESFPVRQQAHVELAKYGTEITPLLQQCAAESPSREARYRANVLLESVQLPFGHGHQREIRALASSGGPTPILASASKDGTVLIWRPHLSLATRVIRAHDEGAWAVAFSPANDELATGGGDHQIHLWDVNKGTNRQTLLGHEATIQELSYSPNGTQIASAGGFDKTVRIWNPRLGIEVVTLQVDDEPKLRVSFHPSGQFLAAAGYGGNVTVWQTSDWSVHQTIATGWDTVRCLRYSPDGRWLAIGGSGDDLVLQATDTSPTKIHVNGHQLGVLAVAFSADRQTFATGDSAGAVRWWRLRSLP